MERLTFEGSFCDITQCRELPCPYNGACSQRKAWERLRAYEDTGLSPQACAEAREAGKVLSSCDISFGRLAELLTADKDGRVAVLPVKPVLTPIISSMLYIIEDGDIYEDALYEAVVGMSESGKTNVVYTTLSNQMIFEQADIGKTVFLTREEAEKALETIKKGKTEHA